MKEEKLILLNKNSRVLIERGRCYSSFHKKQILPYVEEFKNHGAHLIFDPMSGYGNMTEIYNKMNIDTFNVDLNTVAYLWQTLTSYRNIDKILMTINSLTDANEEWLDANCMADSSIGWLADSTKPIINSLFESIHQRFSNICDNKEEAELLSLSLLIPFSSRLSTCSNGDAIHIKKGGVVIYHNYKKDFIIYLRMIATNLQKKKKKGIDGSNIVLLDNSINSDFMNYKFSHMITSPDLPTFINHTRLFAPEYAVLEHLKEEGYTSIPTNKDLLGSRPKQNNINEDNNLLTSAIAKKFLDNIPDHIKGTKKQKQYFQDYCIPYFKNYFANLEALYKNISNHTENNFEGIIVTRNNSTRGNIIPTIQTTKEIWENLGFDAQIMEEEEKSHIGIKNPRIKRIAQLHSEAIIKVKRK